MRMQDRVVLISGSGSGIGYEVAAQSLREGAKVMVHDRDEATTQAAVASLGHPDRVGGVSGDLARIETPTRLVEATLDRFGQIDGLVNNASVSARTSLENTKPEDFDEIFAINLRAPLFLIQAAWPSFRAQGHGYVVNIGSVCAYCGGEHLIDYSMSKGGLLTLTRNLSASHAKHGLRINMVNPGWTVTPNEIVRVTQVDGSPENFEEMIPQHVMPFGRLLRPTDLAPFICMLLSSEGAMLSGNVYDFNPGTIHGRLWA
jgi:NAD(P)-dependent dehydrogenase (short-subunit alcohol dehydrogenase family)